MEQVMDQDLSERIRERAYQIWIANGYRDGEADQHWLAAEQEILSSLRSAAVAQAPAKRIGGRATVKRFGGGRIELQTAFRTHLSVLAAGFPHWFRS